jgi:hypothetical protein
MLDPDDRHLLVEALKPPPGMTLDIAVGTTFTLDLQALLVAPVSFALFLATAPGGESDSLALLEAVRRNRLLTWNPAQLSTSPWQLDHKPGVALTAD